MIRGLKCPGAISLCQDPQPHVLDLFAQLLQVGGAVTGQRITVADIDGHLTLAGGDRPHMTADQLAQFVGRSQFRVCDRLGRSENLFDVCAENIPQQLFLGADVVVKRTRLKTDGRAEL